MATDGPRRSGFESALDKLEPGDREAVLRFQRYLRGEVALAADKQTYVELDDPRAVHFAPKLEGR